jgi:hypothetical protein
MTQVITRASRFKRSESSTRLLFTERDFDILYSLYKYHLLTTHQLVDIHQGNKQKTRWRLRKLFDAGYVHRFNTKTDYSEPGSEPLAYALTDQGANWLSENRPDIERLNRRYNENNTRRTISTIPHTLMVSEIMMRFELACYYNAARASFTSQHEILMRAPEHTRHQRKPMQWYTQVMLQGKPFPIGNNPDQLFSVSDNRPEGIKTAYFFLEADRGTESVLPRREHLEKSTIYRKLLGYYNTHVHKLHHKVFGASLRNFRVLWIVDSEGKDRNGRTRLDNFLYTANKVTDGRIPDLFLFTTYEAFKQDNPLTHEWVNAKGEGRRIIP